MTVVTRGFDCGFGPPSVSSAQASPYGHFWATYLRKRTSSGIHVLNAATAAAYKAAKIPLVFLYEDADPARLVNSGRAGGAADAQVAANDLAALGITDYPAVYFCADTDTNSGQYATIAAYLQGAASVIGVARVGLYGEANLIDYVRSHSLASWFFQPYAWSGQRIAAGVHIYQGNSQSEPKRPWQTVIGGITCDIDEALQTNYGQWPAPATPLPPNEGDSMSFISNQAEFNKAMSEWANASPDQGFREALDTYFASRIPDSEHPTPGSISERLANRNDAVLGDPKDEQSLYSKLVRALDKSA